MKKRFRVGMEVLLSRYARWLRGARIGLVSHMAALSHTGATAAEMLYTSGAGRLTALFGPEHGFVGAAGAGASVRHRRHPAWGLPVYSLYGKFKRPTMTMLKDIDLLVFDLQDLGARPYTYVSTLRYVLEAACASAIPVIVADRPVPLPRVVDGPILETSHTSFVGAIPAPMCYGMTPGETALWLQRRLHLNLDLRVAPMSGYHRQPGRDADWPAWLPPSPGIRAWETARCYLTTVFSEALRTIDIGRGTNLAFQVFGAKWMRSAAVLECLRAQKLPGVIFFAHPYQPDNAASKILDGIRIVVRDPNRFRPVTTSIAIIACLQSIYGAHKLWRAPQARHSFFDQLYGTAQTREALQAGISWQTIANDWRGAARRFKAERQQVLLY